MDIVIKNIESLRNDIDGQTQTPQRVVVDFSKAGTDEFTQLFFDACDDIKMSDLCVKCKNYHNDEKTVNCKSYITPEFSCYEEKPKPSEPIHNEAYIKMCANCKYCEIDASQEPCRSCWRSMGNRPNYWEPAEPRLKEKADLTYDNKPDYDSKPEDVVSYDEEAEKSYLKEVTSRMQSEFDATGKDVKIFMNGRVIKR